MQACACALHYSGDGIKTEPGNGNGNANTTQHNLHTLQVANVYDDDTQPLHCCYYSSSVVWYLDWALPLLWRHYSSTCLYLVLVRYLYHNVAATH